MRVLAYADFACEDTEFDIAKSSNKPRPQFGLCWVSTSRDGLQCLTALVALSGANKSLKGTKEGRKLGPLALAESVVKEE